MEVSSLWFNAQFTMGAAPHVLRLRRLEGKILKPFIQIDFENDCYQVKTVNHPEELAQVLRLRFEVFFGEFSSKKIKFPFLPYDVDWHDFSCDHLIVKDKKEGKVVACYRLLSSRSEKKKRLFYSEGEFEIDDLMRLPGHKLELGRACVHRDYRNGAVISLLWKGLIEYARKSKTRYLFGCSSINRKDFSRLPEMMKYLEVKDAFIAGMEVVVKPKYRVPFSIESSSVVKADGKVMNSLMHMYLMAGAKMGKTVAYDSEMDCLDMFTVLDLHNLPPSFERRFA
ncbi:MAG: GNAT family N-acetyltransferase [Bacteriovoracia bacterium]